MEYVSYRPCGVKSTGFISVYFHVYTRIPSITFFSRSVGREDKKLVTVYLPMYSWYYVNT